MEFSPERRRVLALGAAAGAVLAAGSILPRQAFAAEAKQVTLDECMAMTPEQMAKSSSHVNASWNHLGKACDGIKDARLKAAVRSVLDNPAPTLAAKLDDKNRAEAARELTAKGYLKEGQPLLPPVADASRQPQSFLCSPGSGYQSHHSYPGGLVTHTAGNMMISEAIFAAYKDVYGFEMDRDFVVASQMLHDLHKPWVFQWGASGESRTENTLAGTGEHHVLGVAESIVRGMPSGMVVAQACAHNHPGSPKDEAEVVGWITAAAILAGIDPVAAGLLDKNGKTLPEPRRMEGFVTHLGDHDWVLTVPAAKWTIAAMHNIARNRYGMSDDDLKGKKFNALRNYAFSQATVEALYAEYSVKGEKGLETMVAAMVKPVA